MNRSKFEASLMKSFNLFTNVKQKCTKNIKVFIKNHLSLILFLSVKWDNSFTHILGVMNDIMIISFYFIFDSNLSTGILILSAFHKTHRSKFSLPLDYWWLSVFFILFQAMDWTPKLCLSIAYVTVAM